MAETSMMTHLTHRSFELEPEEGPEATGVGHVYTAPRSERAELAPVRGTEGRMHGVLRGPRIVPTLAANGAWEWKPEDIGFREHKEMLQGVAPADAMPVELALRELVVTLKCLGSSDANKWHWLPDLVTGTSSPCTPWLRYLPPRKAE